MPSRFFEINTKSGTRDKRRLSAFIDVIVAKHQPAYGSINISYVFCTDEYLVDINQKFLKHDTYTDIITFDLSENKRALTGEIYISVERVRENARLFEVKYSEELHRVIFHGVLHLCGYKDKTNKDREIMREKENDCLDLYFARRKQSSDNQDNMN